MEQRSMVLELMKQPTVQLHGVEEISVSGHLLPAASPQRRIDFLCRIFGYLLCLGFHR